LSIRLILVLTLSASSASAGTLCFQLDSNGDVARYVHRHRPGFSRSTTTRRPSTPRTSSRAFRRSRSR